MVKYPFPGFFEDFSLCLVLAIWIWYAYVYTFLCLSHLVFPEFPASMVWCLSLILEIISAIKTSNIYSDQFSLFSLSGIPILHIFHLCNCPVILAYCLLFLFFICLFCFSIWKISIYISSISLIISLAMTTLLMSLWKTLFISINAIFFLLLAFPFDTFLEFPSVFLHYSSTHACCSLFHRALSILIIVILSSLSDHFNFFVISESSSDVCFLSWNYFFLASTMLFKFFLFQVGHDLLSSRK